MSPTFFGESIRMRCPECDIRWTANWQRDFRRDSVFPCWNCGGTVDPALSDFAAVDEISIDLAAYRHSRPEIGDVVAIRDGSGLRVKRIIATGGQTLRVEQYLIYRDDAIAVANAPDLVVHDDSHRRNGESWWRPGNDAWTRTVDGFDFYDQTDNTNSSLVYHHRSPYQNMNEDVVRDDYACNLNEIRELLAAHDLRVTSNVVVSSPTVLRVEILSRGTVYVSDVPLAIGTHTLSQHTTRMTRVVDNALEHPVRMTARGGSFKMRNIVVSRDVLYRIDTRREGIEFPVKLLPQQIFVIGDNVPLSVDSRQHGPVDQAAIIGRVVTPKEAAE